MTEISVPAILYAPFFILTLSLEEFALYMQELPPSVTS